MLLPMFLLAIYPTVTHQLTLCTSLDPIHPPTNLALRLAGDLIDIAHSLFDQLACRGSTLWQATNWMKKYVDERVLGLMQIGTWRQHSGISAPAAVGASISSFCIAFGLVFGNYRRDFSAELVHVCLAVLHVGRSDEIGRDGVFV
jgi:hypothetical protein